METALASRRTASGKVRALFGAFARRVEEGEYCKSCPAGTVCLDLDAELDSLRNVVADALDTWTNLIARHFSPNDGRSADSFAGLLLTAIEGAYICARAERSSRPFKEAGDWLADLAAAHFEPRRVSTRSRRTVTTT